MSIKAVDVKSYDYLIQILKKNPDINYIANAVTPWHAIGVDSAIALLKEKNPFIKGLSLVRAHSKTGFCCDEEIFTNQSEFKFCIDLRNHGFNKIKLFFSFYGFLLKNIIKQKKDDFFIIGATPDPILAILALKYLPNRHIKFLIIDDGVAKYMGTLVAAKPQKGFINQLKYFRVCLENHLITNYTDLESLGLLKRAQNAWLKNETIVPYYRNTLKILSNKLKISNILPEKNFIICTTAWSREHITKDEDLEQLKLICSFLHSQGYNLMMKPHPRDSFFIQHMDELYCTLLDADSTAMEVICEKYHFQGIISFSSTILITAKVLFDIPTYCISDMLDRTKINEVYLNEIDSFKKTFQQTTHFVKSITDMKRLLERN